MKIKKEIEEEIEISVPSFFKTNIFYFKILNNDRCLMVCNMNNHYEIAMKPSGIVFSGTLDAVQITEQEFQKQLNLITNKLLQL